MDKQKQIHSKYSFNSSKFKSQENTPKKKFPSNKSYTKQKDFFSRDNQTIQFKDSEVEKSIHNVDLNAKIGSLSNEITVIKEKLTDMNLSNTHLKTMLKEKTPNKSMSQRQQFIIKDNVNNRTNQQHLLFSQTQLQNNERSMCHTFLKTASADSNDKSYLMIQSKNRYTHGKEEVKEKEKQIEQLKEKSKKLESLVITLENKLDKSNTLLPSIITKAKEYHRLYDETKKENEKIKHQSKYSADSRTLEYCINHNIPQELISVDDNYNEDENETDNKDKNKEQIEALTNINNILKEEKEQIKRTIDEMNAHINYSMSFKNENDKLIKELSKIKEDNLLLKQDLLNKTHSILTMTNEIKDIKNNFKKNENEYYNQILTFTKEKEELINDNKRIMNDKYMLENKSKEDNENIIKHKKVNDKMQDQIDSLTQVIKIKEDELINSNSLLNKIEIEKANLIKDIDMLYKEHKDKENELDIMQQKYKLQYESEQIQLSNKIKQYKSDIETFNKTIVDYREEIFKLKKNESIQVNALKKELTQLEEKYCNLLKEKESEVRLLKLNSENKDKEITELHKKLNENKDENKNNEIIHKNTICNLNSIKDSLQNDLNTLKNNNDIQDKEVIDLRQLIVELKKEIKAKEDKTIVIEDKESIINQLNKKLNDQHIELNDIIQSKEKEIDKLEIESKTINCKLSHLKIVIEEKETEEKKDEMTLNDILINYNLTEDNLAQLEDSNIHSNTNYPSNIRLIDKLKIENHILERKMNRYKQLTNDIEDLKKSQLESKKELISKNEEIANITLILNDNKIMSNNQVEEHKAIISQLTKDNLQLKLQYNTIKKQLNCELRDKQIQIETNKDLLNQFNQLKESYANTEKMKVTLQEGLIKDKTDIEAKINSLVLLNDHDKEEHKKAIEKSTKKIKSLTTTNENKIKDINEFKRAIEKKDFEIKSLKQENLDLTNDLLQAQSKITEVQNRLKKEQIANKQNDEITNSKLNQITNSLIETKEHCTLLQNKLDITIQDYEGLVKNNEELNVVIKDLNQTIKLKEEDINRNKDQMALLNSNSTNQLNLMNITIKEMKLGYENKDNEIKELKNDLDKKLKEMSQSIIYNKTIEKNYLDSTKLLQEENDELTLRLNQIKQTIVEKDNIINQKQIAIEVLNKEIHNNKEIITSKDSELNTLNNKLKEYKEEFINNEIKEQQLPLLKANEEKVNDVTKNINQLNTILKTKNSEICDLKKTDEINENEIIALQDELKENRSIISNMQIDINKKQTYIDELKQIKEDYYITIKDSEDIEYENKLKDKDNVIQEQQNEMIKLTEVNNKFSIQISNLQAKDNEINILMKDNKELKSQLTLIQQELCKLTTESSPLESNQLMVIESLKKELNQKEQELIEFNKAIEESNTMNDKEVSDTTNTLKEEIKQLKFDIEKYKSSNEKMQLDLDTIKSEYNQKEKQANDEIKQLKAQDKIQKEENDKLTAHLLIITTNSTRSAHRIETQSNEANELLKRKEEETDQLHDDILNIQIKYKALQEEYDLLSSQIVNLKETIIQKEISLQDKEDSNKELQKEVLKLKEDSQSSTNKISKMSSLVFEVDRLNDVITEKDIELQNYQKINDKLIIVNQELSEKVNLESKETQKVKKQSEDISDKEGEISIDKDEYMSLLMKNDNLNELIRNKEDEITELKKELDFYKNEINISLNNDNESQGHKGKDSSSLVTSFNQNDDISKYQEIITKIKKAYKDKDNEVNILKQETGLLKGDIRNYQSKFDKIKKECPYINDYNAFKIKIISVLNDYKPKKKEQIEIVKELKNDIGEDLSQLVQVHAQENENEKKTSFLDYFKNRIK